MKQRRNDLILIIILLLAAAAAWLLTARSGTAGGWAVVMVDGKEIGRYSLQTDLEMTIGEADYNILEIRDGTALVTDANCGDHTCVRQGAISRTGETIICLPHRLVIEITGAGGHGPDAVVG